MSIDLYSVFLKTLLIKAKVSYSFSHLPKTIKRYTLLKSPHVYKKAKEHFELRTYTATLNFSTLSSSLIKLILSNKPKSINIKLLLLSGHRSDTTTQATPIAAVNAVHSDHRNNINIIKKI